jgi:uncharacterized RDD family membrane protein YckC
MSAAVPALEALPGGRPIHEVSREPAREHLSQPAAEARQESENVHAPFQSTLFQTSALSPKVVPIPTLSPASPWGGAKRGMAHAAAASASPSAPVHGSVRTSRGTRRSDLQPSLFDSGYDTSMGTRALGMEVDAVIYCDAPVAVPLHRFIAACTDASMVLIAMGLFLGIFLLSGGQLVFNKQVIPIFGAMAGLMWALYHTFWCMANGDTPGMRFAGLQVVNFDGRPATRQQRGLRQTAFVLSALSAGVGLFWAFVDEENLTWHDHISKTFPTPGQ